MRMSALSGSGAAAPQLQQSEGLRRNLSALLLKQGVNPPPKTTSTTPEPAPRHSTRLETGYACQFTVEVVDLVRFQAEAAVHLGSKHAPIPFRVRPWAP